MRIIKRYSSTIYGQYRSTGLKYGLWVGLAMSAFVFLAFMLLPDSIQPHAPENYYGDGVMLFGMILAAYRYRQNLPDHHVTLKEIMLLCLWIGVVASTIYGIYLWLHCSLDDHLCQRFADSWITKAATNAAEDTTNQGLTATQYTAGNWGFIGGFRSAVISIILNLFTALLMRTEKAPVRK